MKETWSWAESAVTKETWGWVDTAVMKETWSWSEPAMTKETWQAMALGPQWALALALVSGQTYGDVGWIPVLGQWGSWVKTSTMDTHIPDNGEWLAVK